MSVFLTSDSHFHHINILKPEYCDRPFKDVDHMNQMLVQYWNERVGPNDTVIHIGDMFMGLPEKWMDIRNRLNGEIILVYGNHDCKRKEDIDIIKPQILKMGFEIHKELYTEIDGIKVYCRHIPDMTFKPSDRAQYHLCGHVHQAFSRKGSIINVGVDIHNYRPITIQEAILTPEWEGKKHR